MNTHTKFTLRLVALILGFIAVGIYTCSAQTLTKSGYERKVFRDTVNARVASLLKKVGENETLSELQTFLADSAALAEITVDGYRVINKLENLLPLKWCPVFDSDMHVVETRRWSKLTAPIFSYQAGVLYVPRSVLDYPYRIIQYIDQAYQVQMYISTHRYDAGHPALIEYQQMIAELNQSLMKPIFGVKYTNLMIAYSLKIKMSMRSAKKTIPDMYPVIDSLGKDAAMKLFGAETVQQESDWQCQLMSIQLARALTTRVFAQENEKEELEKKGEADKAYIEYVFSQKK